MLEIKILQFIICCLLTVGFEKKLVCLNKLKYFIIIINIIIKKIFRRKYIIYIDQMKN